MEKSLHGFKAVGSVDIWERLKVTYGFWQAS